MDNDTYPKVSELLHEVMEQAKTDDDVMETVIEALDVIHSISIMTAKSRTNSTHDLRRDMRSITKAIEDLWDYESQDPRDIGWIGSDGLP